ncbi:proline dehydrogenase family protein [Actinoallomurus rhizosphaericola]|uniref:proline dehydrogenase family protein n=1 Tax=Actinoallomurus rhizosphaericola TaxID=2952536 RepID=UPI002090ED1A|nr:proline dehydrogenase family protein [Actinoallomurus rhizosphaericola]MCO5994452.1 proline dehydrogenase family protein [Actinoallomurus rhizosphaericola]
MLRQALLAASHSSGVRRVVETAPYSRSVVRRFVAGEAAADVLTTTDRLISDGLLVTIDHLGEDTVEAVQAKAITTEYERLLERLAEAGYGPRAEVSVKLTALGQLLDGGERTALENARRVCAAARQANTTVTLDMEDHTRVDSTLRILKELRQDFPETGAVIQAYLRRAEEYCADLAYEGSRVRLCKGAYNAPDSVAFTGKDAVDKSYVRCMRVLMAGRGYPMLATHDPRLIEIAGALAILNERSPDGFEYQMLYGIRPNEQRRLTELGGQVRVYVPYGREWYGYLMRRLAERPANVGFFLRSLASRS